MTIIVKLPKIWEDPAFDGKPRFCKNCGNKLDRSRKITVYNEDNGNPKEISYELNCYGCAESENPYLRWVVQISDDMEIEL